MPINFMPLPSFDRLDELLVYDPDSGELRWKVNRSNVKAGSIAGCIKTRKDGRRDWTISIDGKLYISTRIIWALYHHEDPGILTIDHINQNPLNNRISNLRLATAHEQVLNMSTTSPSTAVRYLGLVIDSRKSSKGRPRWVGKIRVAGKYYTFGSAGVDTINDEPPSWLVERAARIYALRNDPDITDDTLIDLIKGLKRPSGVEH